MNDNSFKYIFDQTKFVNENKNVKKSNIDLVNIESDLTNRSRFLSKCPTKLYQPKKKELRLISS